MTRAALGWWLASRASGIVALLLLTLSTAVGLTLAARVVRRPRLKPALMRLHEHVALSALVAIAVHGVTLLGDGWLHPGLEGVAVPFALAYRPAFTGAGVVGGYLAFVLALSFYARRRIGARRWRSLHRLTIVAYALAVVHTLGSGSDAATTWMLAPLLAACTLIAALLALRLRPRRTAPRPKAAAVHALAEEPA